jgi:hypothetical protein
VLCGAELIVDVLAVLGSNKGSGAIAAASTFFSVVPQTKNGKPEVTDGFSCTTFVDPSSMTRKSRKAARPKHSSRLNSIPAVAWTLVG